MKEKVFFVKMADNEDDQSVCAKLEKAINENDFFSFIKPKDMVAFKTHFGEQSTTGYVRPLYFKMMGDIVKKKNGIPFLTETSTLYRGKRTNAVEHIEFAYEHGFIPQNTGLPIIMADGLMGDQEIEVKIAGKLYPTVKIASLIVKSQALILVSHFTGHLITGFGAALKNMGMGCSSRRGKLIQHSTARPSIVRKKCTACEECIKWCPQDAVAMIDGKAEIDKSKCIGCGECLAVCRFDAVNYNWSATYVDLQRKVVEHAMGVYKNKENKSIYVNFLNRVSKDCDCMGRTEKILPDIGVLISFDPVAVDAASLDLVEEKAGKHFSKLTYDIPYKEQIDYARELGFGSAEYEIIELD
ncbi:MAG: DUF362 domain-containing protein [Candidatus Aminicenantes bacterium]|nr:DUF362 domain-containing protein [Candidatus Aminicenantes bacterium]NIM82987.1 DUF362 domain-containing protein [Candidatus Aminicenantes bacterium]NIN22373.1 DUF362 domain-containing protein [Candidatus Aminicenantes bacterium]NIN46133.1 DUF362 domain-containing protein [Candidatus Aminicenantes bacterium]NIN88969.1 DUF362 domain-containing protein [Candidatus Aminicenantes bacterium]